MPARRSYTRYHRRYHKRSINRRKYSRLNTYRNRSSKAQAYQIYSLNKKINHVYKLAKPEIQVYESADCVVDAQLYSESVSGRSFELHRCIDQSLGIFSGRYVRCRDITFTGGFNWDGNPGTDPQSKTGCLRLIFFRPKQQQWAIPSIGDIIPYTQDKDNEYFMRCPLNRGFSMKYALVGDYKFYLNPQTCSSRCIKIHMKYPYSLRRSIEIDPTRSPNNAFPTNSLFCVSYICRIGGPNVLDTFGCGLYMKLAYTDDHYYDADANRAQTNDQRTIEEPSTSDTNECKNDDSNDTVYPTST